MLDPAEYDDVIVTVAHPWGGIEASLAGWIQVGPGSRPLVTIIRAWGRDGSPVPLEEIPLQYRNTEESRRLQRLGLLPSPWGPPADEPPPRHGRNSDDDE
jgi:hypothetical protein